MLDLALALSALIWFCVFLFPVYGFVAGRRDRQEHLKRAQGILLSLVALLVLFDLTLGVMVSKSEMVELMRLRSYRWWMLGAVAVSLGCAWILFKLAQKTRST
ncbi:hypothetical protein shim_14480 [Shimia sp. SK013]|uniref:hypothetical protein n=1 Tax=Shimia sp. SK013 TaxID=1389006 RepID=UPI0006B68E0F|nr:hypothetical protein [Shimia sp. SK013]KPA23153.1 hypothetical protein shim_14480 [Shimia sp. SK013]